MQLAVADAHECSVGCPRSAPPPGIVPTVQGRVPPAHPLRERWPHPLRHRTPSGTCVERWACDFGVVVAAPRCHNDTSHCTHRRGNAHPAARNLGNYHGTGGVVPFVNGTFEWGAVIATFLSILSLLPHHCARLTCFLHPNLKKSNAVLITPQPITLTLWPCGAPVRFWGQFGVALELDTAGAAPNESCNRSRTCHRGWGREGGAPRGTQSPGRMRMAVPSLCGAQDMGGADGVSGLWNSGASDGTLGAGPVGTWHPRTRDRPPPEAVHASDLVDTAVVVGLLPFAHKPRVEPPSISPRLPLISPSAAG